MSRTISVAPGRVPIHLWPREVPDGALAQLEAIASQPYVVAHVAAMPDLHVAKGVAVGTVFATDGTVVPSALGGDLGCGMRAVRFDVPASALSTRTLERVLSELGRAIPVGDATHRGRGVEVPETLYAAALSTSALAHERERLAPKHLGTLGGGNHFVELDRDGGGALWLLVHSGSRGLGAAIAHHHLRSAETVGVGNIPGLPAGTAPAEACLADVGWALDFARAIATRWWRRRRGSSPSTLEARPSTSSTCTTTSSAGRRTSAARCSCTAKAPSRPRRESARSFPARWAPPPTWWKGVESPPPSAPPRTAQAGCSPGKRRAPR